MAVAGAGGFVGRHLVRALVDAGHPVRRLARRPSSLEPIEGVDDRAFDLEGSAGLVEALAGVDTVHYLVHAMGDGGDFAGRDRAYAHRFAAAARRAGVRHVVYLGGLYPAAAALSAHLDSRREVGAILRERCGALCVRAGIIVGAGSISFEMMCDLVRRLPAMVTPRWVRSRCQPVEISDAVAALVRCVDVPGNREVDLVGPEVLTYEAMLQHVAVALGLRPRLLVRVPVLSPGLSARWLRFVTAVPLPVARALVRSLRHDAVATGADLCAEVGIRPCGFDDAVVRALRATPRVTGREVERSRRGTRTTVVQRFHVAGRSGCDRRLVDGVDAALRRATCAAAPGLLRWRDGDLLAGPWPLVRLGPPAHDDGAGGAVARTIRGGALVGRPGGALVVGCRPDLGPCVVEARVEGYAPRLRPLPYRLVQERLHRALVDRAVRRALVTTAGDRATLRA